MTTERARANVNWQDTETFLFVGQLPEGKTRQEMVAYFKELFAAGHLSPNLRLAEVAHDMEGTQDQQIVETYLAVDLNIAGDEDGQNQVVTYCQFPLSGNSTTSKVVDGRDRGTLRLYISPLSDDENSLTGLAAKIDEALDAETFKKGRSHAGATSARVLGPVRLEEPEQPTFMNGVMQALGQVRVEYATAMAAMSRDQQELAGTLMNMERLAVVVRRMSPDFDNLPPEAQMAGLLKLQEKVNDIELARENGDAAKEVIHTRQEANLSLQEMLKKAAGRAGRGLFGVGGTGDDLSDDLLQRLAMLNVAAGSTNEEAMRAVVVVQMARTELALADKNKGLAKADVREREIALTKDEWDNRVDVMKGALNALAETALDNLEKGFGIVVGQLPNEQGMGGKGLLGLGHGLPKAVITGTLTGIGEGTGSLIGKFQEKAHLKFPDLSPLTQKPEYSLTLVGLGGGVIVTVLTVGSSVVLLASGAGLGAGLGLFSVWGVREIVKRFGKKGGGQANSVSARPMVSQSAERQGNGLPQRPSAPPAPQVRSAMPPALGRRPEAGGDGEE